MLVGELLSMHSIASLVWISMYSIFAPHILSLAESKVGVLAHAHAPLSYFLVCSNPVDCPFECVLVSVVNVNNSSTEGRYDGKTLIAGGPPPKRNVADLP